MLIQCSSELAVAPDEPVAALQTLVGLLRRGAADTESARIDLNLVTTSARGLSVVQEFQPQRTRSAGFLDALAITEELTRLEPAKLKSLHIMISAQGFRWKGSREGSEARAALLDGKSFQRKKRFTLAASLSFEAPSIEDPSLNEMLRSVETETGLHFELPASHVQIAAGEPGRATADQLLVTALTWNEIIESVGQRLRSTIRLDDEPRVMTHSQATSFLYDPERTRTSARVDFARQAQRWLKAEFGEYARTTGPQGDGYADRVVTPEVSSGFAIDKKVGAFSKAFTLWVAAGLTSKRFAPAPERPARLAVNLFRLFGIAPLPLVWTYHTAQDLSEAFASASRLLKPALALLEAQAPRLAGAGARPMSEFSGPRIVSARHAYDLALLDAHQWAADAGLMRINITPAAAQHFPLMLDAHPILDGSGQLAASGGWWLQFHSKQKQQNLHVVVPCYGPISQTIMDAPVGRQYPSDVDHLLRDGWIDSTEAARLALFAAAEKSAEHSAQDLQLVELASHGNILNTTIIGSQLRDGMFNMEAWWRVSFKKRGAGDNPVVDVRIPAYGDGRPIVEIR